MRGAARIVQLSAGAQGQGFGIGEAHAVAVAGAARGIGAHGGAQLGCLIVAAEHGNVLKNDAQLAHAGRLGRVGGVQGGAAARGAESFLFGNLGQGSGVPEHADDDLLEPRHAAFVDGALQLVDGLQMFQIAVLPVLEIEELQMRDAALAVPEQIEHVFGGEPRQIQGDAAAALEIAQPREQVQRRLIEQLRTVGGLAGVLERGSFGKEFGIVQSGNHGFGGELVQSVEFVHEAEALFRGNVGRGE